LASRYRRLDEHSGPGAIARGTFGKVFVAVDTRTENTVAVKRQVLPSDAASRELCWYKALSQEKHRNLMDLLDHFVCKGTAGTCLYMVFDFMDTTLWHFWTQRRRVVPISQSIVLIRDLSSAIAHLHHVGVIHADLSMSNMLIALTGSAAASQERSWPCLRVTDFGGAVSASGVVLPADTVITTESARAPEVILGSVADRGHRPMGSRRGGHGLDVRILGLLSH